MTVRFDRYTHVGFEIIIQYDLSAVSASSRDQTFQRSVLDFIKRLVMAVM